MSDTINITTTIVEEVIEITTTDNQTIVNIITQPSGTVTKTSDLINDGADGTSTFVETNELAQVATSGSYNDLTDTPTIPTTPNLTQVLNVSDRPVILHDVANGDFTFDTTHIGKYICFTGGGIIDAVIPDNTYDPAIWVNLVGSVGYGTFINLKCNGGTMSRIIGHEFRIIPFEVKLAEPLTNGWVVNAEPISHFEVQLTQHGTNAPEILTSSVIGAMNASISTTYNSDGDYYIVADLPIFANVKDYIKNSVYKKTDFITVYPGISTFGVTVIYVDDYTLRVNTYDYTDSFYVYLLNDVMQEPTLIQIPFKP